MTDFLRKRNFIGSCVEEVAFQGKFADGAQLPVAENKYSHQDKKTKTKHKPLGFQS